MKSYDLENEPIPWTQYLSVLAGSLAMLTGGMHYGWSSPSLPKLEAKDSDVPITSDEGAWIASVLMLGAFASCPFSAWLLSQFGRKTVLLMTTVPFLVSWVLIIFANSAAVFYVERFIGGAAMGVSFAAMPLYIGEIAESHIRGCLGSAISIMYNLGVLVTYSVGPYVTIPMFALISTSIPILLFVTFIWVPESPYYLISKNQTELAKKSLQKLRQGQDIEKEFQIIQEAVEKQMQGDENIFQHFKKESNRKALFIMLGIRTIHQLCGMNSFIFYAEQIFGEAGGVLNSSMSAVIYGILQLVACIMSSVLLDRAGRKPLLLVSCVGSAICLAVEGFCFFRNDHKLLPDVNLTWLPMAAALVFVLVSNVGLGVVPYVMVGELFPTKIKGLATCMCIMYFDFLAVVVNKLYQVATDYLGAYVPFWIFMLSCIVGAVFIVFCVPETKGKSLEEIQEILEGNCKHQNVSDVENHQSETNL